MRVSREAIYQSLYIEGRGGLTRELVASLRTGRALRRPRARAKRLGAGFITEDVTIGARRDEVDDRVIAGPLGISMVLSSGLSERWRCRCPGPVLAQQRP